MGLPWAHGVGRKAMSHRLSTLLEYLETFVKVNSMNFLHLVSYRPLTSVAIEFSTI